MSVYLKSLFSNLFALMCNVCNVCDTIISPRGSKKYFQFLITVNISMLALRENKSNRKHDEYRLCKDKVKILAFLWDEYPAMIPNWKQSSERLKLWKCLTTRNLTKRYCKLLKSLQTFFCIWVVLLQNGNTLFYNVVQTSVQICHFSPSVFLGFETLQMVIWKLVCTCWQNFFCLIW